ncbi:hypothetical protein EDB83DRAFT_2440013 [Lactarius deliciosus]|nr:hypothetical protein EDB83DRAFT_2440013 [Lactarius deliciosus]
MIRKQAVSLVARRSCLLCAAEALHGCRSCFFQICTTPHCSLITVVCLPRRTPKSESKMVLARGLGVKCTENA